jgi:hypothetical protein
MLSNILKNVATVYKLLTKNSWPNQHFLKCWNISEKCWTKSQKNVDLKNVGTFCKILTKNY